MCDAEPAPDKTAELLETNGTAAAAAAAAMPETPPDKEWHGTSLVPKIDDSQIRWMGLEFEDSANLGFPCTEEVPQG